MIPPSNSDPEMCDDYDTETESFVGPIRRRRGRGRGRARGGRLLRDNTDPPPELEKPTEIPKQEPLQTSVPLGIGQTVSSLTVNIYMSLLLITDLKVRCDNQ